MKNKLKYYLITYTKLLILDEENFDIDFPKFKFVLIISNKEFNINKLQTISEIDEDIREELTEFDYYNRYFNLPTILKYKNIYKVL